MFIDKSTCTTALVACVIVFGCSGTDSSNTGSAGGSLGMGGSDSSGGISGIGGMAATGGMMQTGGSSNMGGALATGGANNSGGTPSTGGTNSTGGVISTGGSKPIGGTTSTGGSRATGGVSPVGGSNATGGFAATGGANLTGGSKAVGGTTATGGTSPTGGSKATGGAATTGGTTGTGGSGAAFQCNNLPAATGSTGVAKPSGTAGNLKVINWAGYTGAVTYTFDDANQSQIDNYSTLNGLGVHLTFYLITDKSTMSSSVWPQAVKDGHELGNHTNDHNTISAANIDTATTYIEQHFGVTPYTFAAPNGTNGSTGYEQFAKTRFLIDRGVANALIMPNDNTDQWNLSCYIPPTNGTAANDFNPQIDSAQSGGGWRVVLVHGFTGGTDGAYQPVALSEFTSGVTHAKSLGNMWIDSMMHVGSYWVGQKLISSTTSTTSGGVMTWTWSWPSIYPPNSCLRVTVGGGTLKQNGNALTWDSHGYYQISLDAGSLTLSP